jgi:hypothetical protein
VPLALEREIPWECSPEHTYGGPRSSTTHEPSVRTNTAWRSPKGSGCTCRAMFINSIRHGMQRMST